MQNKAQALCLLFIVVGIFLRVDNFVQNRSLRDDEALYFECLVSRTPTEVLLNEKYNLISPPSPIGFSFIEREIMDHGGYSEYALRFIPFIFSLGGLLLFYYLVSQYFSSWTTLWATGLFALSNQLIFFSADMRPYSIEVFFAILALWMSNRLVNNVRLSDCLCFGAMSAVSVWFSYTVVFILGGVAIASLGVSLFKKQWGNFYKLLLIHGCWAISFFLVFKYTIHPILKAGITNHMWQRFFFHGPHDVINIFADPLGIISPTLGLFWFLAGVFYLYNINNKKLALAIIPIILTLIAALCKKYPFSGRVLLFLVPSLLIFIALGLEALGEGFKGKMKGAYIILVLGIFFIPPLIQNVEDMAYGWDHEDARSAAYFLKNNMLPDDVLLMNNEARYPLGYYMGRFKIDMKDRWVGIIPEILFKKTEYPAQARCVFEQFNFDMRGFLIGIGFYTDRPQYMIYRDQWLKVKYKREWLLLINAPEDLRIFLEGSMGNEKGTHRHIIFKGADLYLLS